MNNIEIKTYRFVSLLVVLLVTLQLQAQFVSNNYEFNNIHNLKKYKEQTYKEGAAVDKQFERWYHFVAPRIGPSGKLQKETFTTQQTLKTFLDQQKITRSNSKHNGYWTFVGGNDYQLTGKSDHSGGVGRLNCISFDPNQPNVFYVGAAAGGLWKTTNSGQTYNCLTNGMSAISVSAIAVDPQNSDNIYISIGDADGAATNYRDVGIVKTTDGGTTWYSTSLFWQDPTIQARVFQILIHPSNSNIMYASTSEGVFKTANSWQTFDTIIPNNSGNNNDFSSYFWDLKFKPSQPDSVYFCDGRQIYIYKADQQDVDTILTTPTINSSRLRINIETNENYPDYLYAIRGIRLTSGTAGNGFQGLYLTTNGGNSWRSKSTSPNILGGDTTQTSDLRSQATYDLSIAVKNTDPSVVIIGGINIWTSADTGTTWVCNSYYRRKTLLNYIHADIHDLEYKNDEVFACTDGGLNRSTNDAVSWLELSAGLGINQIYGIAMSAQDINLTYGGLQDNGLNRFKSDGTMDQVKAGDEMRLVVNSNDADTIIFFRQYGSLYKTYDGGDTTSFVTNFGTNTWDCPIIMDPVDPQKIYIGVDKNIRFSDDSFNSNSAILAVMRNNIWELAQGINNTDRIFIGTSASLYRTDNASTGFDTINVTSTLPVNTANISGITVDPTNADRVWVSFSGFVNGNKIYKSEDAGVSWTNVSGDLPNVPVNCIVYESGSNDGIYIGSDIGVFYRNNDLGHWIYFTNGLPTTVITDLKIHAGSLKIRAGTYGRGVWESDLYISCLPFYNLTAASDPSDPDFTGIQRYEASSYINSTRIITGGYGTDVKYQAGDRVVLNPGFHAKMGNLFEAKPAPCGSQTASRPEQIPITGRLIIR